MSTSPPAPTTAAPPAPLELYWLPRQDRWDAAAKEIPTLDEAKAWDQLIWLAKSRIDFVATMRLDRMMRRRFPECPSGPGIRTERLAVLSSSTIDHLLPGLRVGALRRGFWLDTWTGEYGQYLQELHASDSELHRFEPTFVLISFDADHLLGDGREASDAANKIEELWDLVQEKLHCPVIQQTVMPRAVALAGGNEHRMPASPRRQVSILNERLRQLSAERAVDILGIDDRIQNDGLAVWHDPAIWHRAKQEISPAASHFYGDLAARLMGARRGLSAKCLVMDLDNTLWGGVIGDDGLEGIKLGQGHALGEAYVAFQKYALALSKRGIILAVCSKNEEANALAPFRQHPEMILRLADIACFIANWNDKAANLREIASRLNIGLEHMVFVDDNPFERNLIRAELSAVAVPEMPDDPALYAQCISDAGYFEAPFLTGDDIERTRQYQENSPREYYKASATNLDDYLRDLNMELGWAPFDEIGLPRITQLINKTNQFNLTTRRYDEMQVRAAMEEPDVLTLQLRLRDRFGDNGMVSVIIARPDGRGGAVIDTWLMSCRVLGRGVEDAALNLLAEQAKELGFQYLIGEYLPSEKNAMVADFYERLGFENIPSQGTGSRWKVMLAKFVPRRSFVAAQKMTV